ncbi:DUF1853 family protein [Vibrio gangliei]|uniref:DUF1853 family protein n=2 Tax=Vibrio gangliei TaxID=2077090 RepID=UPI000D015074|nr:DUF1853 family protein [Vibrio gangliei]
MKYHISAEQRDNLFNKISDWMTVTPPLFTPNQHRLADNPFSPDITPLPIEYSGNSRLGFWYQHLCHQLFAGHPHYQILAEEIQLNDQGRTIGALDFVLLNQVSDSAEHWEVAIKFYILFNGYWYGPNSRDRLDLKLSHMLNHQLTMSQHSCFKHLYPTLEHIEPKLLMQGRLYVNPFRDETIPTHCLEYEINTSQINGYWCFFDEVSQIQQPLYALKKGQWLTGKESDSLLLDELEDEFVHCQAEDGRFWFILPNHWPKHCLKT